MRVTNYPVPLVPMAWEPAFATYANTAYIHVYSHNKQFIGEFAQATAGVGSELNNAAFRFNQNVGTQVSSSVPNGYAGTTNATMHGHFLTSVHVNLGQPTTGYNASFAQQRFSTNNIYVGSTQNSQATGVWVNKGRRDYLCFQRYGLLQNYMGGVLTPSGTQVSRLGHNAILNPIGDRQTMFTGTNGYTSNQLYGLIGYNELTKTLVVGDQRGSNTTVEFSVYRNVNPPTLASLESGEFWAVGNIAHGGRIGPQVFTLASTTESLDYMHWKIIPLDDGNIRIVYKNASGQIRTFLFTGNSGNTSTVWVKGTEDTITLTTSYHNQINVDALPHLTTWDGKYTFVYTQYAHYGSGICGYFVRHSDGKYFKLNETDSSNGWQCVPIGRNGILISTGTNQDGVGSPLRDFNMDFLYATSLAAGGDASTYYTWSQLDCPVTSTSYGGIFTVFSPLPLMRGLV